jgi:hypothetical protein
MGRIMFETTNQIGFHHEIGSIHGKLNGTPELEKHH